MGLPGGEQRGYLTLSSSVCVFKENLLDPNVHVDARDCYRNKNGSLEKTARWRRALKTQERQEDEAADGETEARGAGAMGVTHSAGQSLSRPWLSMPPRQRLHSWELYQLPP